MKSTDAGILFLALLAVLCQVFVIGTTTWALAAAGGPGRSSFRRFASSIRPLAAPFVFAVALVTMLGSLYMSEVKNFTPCHLCWIQRSLLYPQVLWTLLLWLRPQWVWVRRLALLMLAGDAGVSLFHYMLEWNPELETSVCSLTTPCSQVWFRQFGYLTLPFMALTSACTQMVWHFVASPSVMPKKFLPALPLITAAVLAYFLLT